MDNPSPSYGPCLHGLMVDDASHIDFFHSITRETATFFFLINPGRKCLFYDPASGTLKTSCHLIDLIG